MTWRSNQCGAACRVVKCLFAVNGVRPQRISKTKRGIGGNPISLDFMNSKNRFRVEMWKTQSRKPGFFSTSKFWPNSGSSPKTKVFWKNASFLEISENRWFSGNCWFFWKFWNLGQNKEFSKITSFKALWKLYIFPSLTPFHDPHSWFWYRNSSCFSISNIWYPYSSGCLSVKTLSWCFSSISTVFFADCVPVVCNDKIDI